jgi:molybdopterin-biosynthesis enzyme MoeA-like protein
MTPADPPSKFPRHADVPPVTDPKPKRVTAAALIIGDEILSGRTADVNLNAIARFVAAHGVELAEGRVVGDVKADIVEALNALRGRWDYVFTTGGIGPTHDDITADCVAEAFGAPLREDPEILAEMAARYGGEVNAARRRMARIPEGGSKVKNPLAGPPGFQIGNVFVLAGVPKIMQGMLEDIGWRLEGGSRMISRTLRVDGAGEGSIAALLEGVALARPSLSLGSYPFFGPEGFGTNLVVRGYDEAEVEAAIAELLTILAGVEGARLSRPSE